MIRRLFILIVLVFLLCLIGACSFSAAEQQLQQPRTSEIIVEETPSFPVQSGSPSAAETFEPNYPPVSFPVQTREVIPAVAPVAIMGGKATHINRTLTALGQQITIDADVVMPIIPELKWYKASLRKQASEQELTAQKDFFFGTGAKLDSADPAFLNRFYQSGTVYKVTSDKRQALIMTNQDVGDVYSVGFYNEGPWRFQVDTDNQEMMNQQAYSLLTMLWDKGLMYPDAYQSVSPASEGEPPIETVTFAQMLDGIPIAVDIPTDGNVPFPHPNFEASIVLKDWEYHGFYGTQLKKGDVHALSVHFLYHINESTSSTGIIPIGDLLDIMEKKTYFLSMVSGDGANTAFSIVRLVYDVDDYASALQTGFFTLKPYWEFGRYANGTFETYRFDADPVAYQ